jgi:integration host factor subunit beta
LVVAKIEIVGLKTNLDHREVKGVVTMNKAGLIKSLAEKENITTNQAGEIVNFIFNSFSQALEKGDRVEIRGFGSFLVKERKPRSARNPKTGQVIPVKARKLPVFKVGKGLKERVDL